MDVKINNGAVSWAKHRLESLYQWSTNQKDASKALTKDGSQGQLVITGL